MSDDPFESPEWREFEHNVKTKMLPQMRGSASVLVIAPNKMDQLDIRFCVQVGACIMLEKPLLVITTPGQVLPMKLMAIADKVIEIDSGDTDSAARQVKKFFDDYGKQ